MGWGVWGMEDGGEWCNLSFILRTERFSCQLFCIASVDITQHHKSQETQFTPSALLCLACCHRMVVCPSRTRLSVLSLPSLAVKETRCLSYDLIHHGPIGSCGLCCSLPVISSHLISSHLIPPLVVPFSPSLGVEKSVTALPLIARG